MANDLLIRPADEVILIEARRIRVLEERPPARHPRTPGLAIGLRKVYRSLIQSVGSSRMLTVGSVSMLELALDICLGLVLGLVLVGLPICRFHLRSPTANSD